MAGGSLRRGLRPLLGRHPGIKRALVRADESLGRLRHSAARVLPALVRPDPRQLTIAVTGACNLRCQGCRYGRDFMVGERIPWPVMQDLLADAKAAGVDRVRFYGGEPLLYPELDRAIALTRELGMDPYITTNGTRLEARIDELYAAGLRWMTMGFYGVGEAFGAYTERPELFAELERGIEKTRASYPDVEMQLNFVMVSHTTNLAALEEAWDFAERHGLFFHMDLYGYSAPFFKDEAGTLAPREADRERIEGVAAELLRLKRAQPERFPQSEALIRSIPDWLLLGKDMRVPCDAYQLIWVGADGRVQLCDVAFELGNLHETRLRDMLFTDRHRTACRDGFRLDCPNCTCKSNTRILKHAASMRRYGRERP